jgi:hypothetical protein
MSGEPTDLLCEGCGVGLVTTDNVYRDDQFHQEDNDDDGAVYCRVCYRYGGTAP